MQRHRIPTSVRRVIARNSVLAVAAAAIAAAGLQSITKERTEFASLVTGFLVAAIYLWILRTPAALLELYITRTQNRRWIYWPHGGALAIVIMSIAGDNGHRYPGDKFSNLLTLQAATFGLLEYLFCALFFLLPTAVVVLVKCRVFNSKIDAGAASERRPPDSHATRRRKAPSRDAAVLALSITTGIAGVAQGFDIHNIGRTILAVAVGAIGLYFIYKLPTMPFDAKDTPTPVAPTLRRDAADE